MNENENKIQKEESIENSSIDLKDQSQDELLNSSIEDKEYVSLEDQMALEKEELERLEQEKRKRIRTEVIEWIKTIIFAVALYFVIDFFIARVIVDGHSMNPGIHDGNLMLVNKVAYHFSEIDYGDVVVFPYPNNPEKDYIKRVIAKEGDTIETIDGLVYVNDEQVDEFYLDPDITQTIPKIVVPEGEVYVLGDNRDHSSDSRRWGTLPEEDIIGKAFFTYWPIQDIGVVK